MACKQNTISAISHHGETMLDNGSPTLPKQLIFHVLVSFKVPQYTGLDLSMQSVDLLRIFPLFVYISMVIGRGDFSKWGHFWMSPYMTWQRTLSGKIFFTYITIERSCFMNSYMMTWQMILSAEMFFTNITMERFLSLVNHLVALHVLIGFEICIALFAFERFFSCVTLLVIGQNSHRFERLSTLIAGEGFFLRMFSLMFLKSLGIYENLFT